MTIGLYLLVNDINKLCKLEEVKSKKNAKHLLYSSDNQKYSGTQHFIWEKWSFLVSVKLGLHNR